MKSQNVIILGVVVIVMTILGGSFLLFNSHQKTKQLEAQIKLAEEKTKQEMLKKQSEENKVTVTTSTTNTEAQTQPKEVMPKSESEERIIVRKPIDVRKGSYCVNPSSSKSYFNTGTVYDPGADHPFMADIYFSDCIIYGTHSQGEYKGRHTGPITMTVSLAEEKNYSAIFKRSKWYLENGEIMRIEGYDYKNVYFNGWLMYKQTQ